MSRRFWLLAFLAVLFLGVGAFAVQQNAADKELKAIQGKWTVVALTEGGKEAKPEEVVGKIAMTFEGDKVTVEIEKDGKSKKEAAKYVVDPSKTPKELDIFPDELAKERKVLAIYELKDNDLRICFEEGGKVRPKDFDANKKMVKLKRAAK